MKRNKNLYGSAMVLAMIFIAISFAGVGGYLSIVTKDSYMAKKMNDSIKALYLADAGIERAVSDLFNGIVAWSPERTLYSDTALGEGRFTVEIQEVISDNRVRLRSTGVVRGEDRTIAAYVSRLAAFDWGVFSDGCVWMSNRVGIDSYDSRLGDYGGDNVNQNGDLGTNAGDGPKGEIAVRLRNHSQIDGDVVIGPNGVLEDDIEIRHHASISGTQSVARARTELPVVEPPEGLPYRGDIDIQRGESVTITESGQYDFIRIKNHSTLNIDADGGEVNLYVIDRISMSNRGSINIIDNTKVNIYVGRRLKFKNRSSVNTNTADPSLLTIYGTNTFEAVEYEHQSQVYGALYLPTADVYMENSATLYGSLVTGVLSLKNSASIHYDEALSGTGPFLGGLLNVDYWQEKY